MSFLQENISIARLCNPNAMMQPFVNSRKQITG